MRGRSAPSRETDAAARLAAQTEFGRPLAVEAGAGTGKTATLVARVVAWCVGEGWELAAREGGGAVAIAARVLDGVVAITFTEDAAAEMAQRVAAAFLALERWTGATRPSEEFPGHEELHADRAEDAAWLRGIFREALPRDPEAVRDRARALLVEIERLRVSTIHAFAASILRRFPVEAGLHPGFSVDASGEMVRELVETAAEEVLQESYEEEDSDALALAELGIGPPEITGAALALATQAVPLEALEEDPFSEERIGELLEELVGPLEQHVDELERLASVSGAAAVKRTAEFLAKIGRIAAAGSGTARDRLREVLGVVTPGYGGVKETLRKWCQKQPDFGQRARAKLKDPEKFSEDIRCLQPVLKALAGMDPAAFNHLRRVVLQILRRAGREKRRRGLVVFQDLLVEARRLLETDTGVRRTLQAEIRQLLVDEMQDTDPEQAALVRLLALDPAAPQGARPCLFLVGDPKQSIYGWRSADLAVYEVLVETICEAGGERHDLVVNFRSVPSILSEVGRIVGPVMHEEKGLQPAFVPLLPCRRLENEEGHVDVLRRPVEHWAIALPAEDGGLPTEVTRASEAARLEARAVALDIATLRAAGEPLSGMAVLMRGRGQLQVLLEELRRQGIPYEVGKDRGYFRTREVLEAMALVRLVLDRHDPLALAAVLRSPLAGVPDAALAPLWRQGLPAAVAGIPGEGGSVPAEASRIAEAAASSVAELGLHRGQGPDALSGWPEALLAFLEILAALRESWRRDPPDRFLEELRRRTLLEPLAAGRFPGAYRLANVERFLGLLEERLLEGATTGSLLAWLRRLAREQPDEPSGRPREDAGEAVRVLTIHGAKGLEFDHVWLVQTHASGGTNQEPANVAGCVGGRWELTLAGLPTPGAHRLAERRTRVEEKERVRLLYVALTRARKRLVTSGCWKSQREGPLLGLMRQRRSPGDGATPGWPTLEDLWTGIGEHGRLDLHGALWSVPGLTAWGEPLETTASAPEAPPSPPVESIVRHEERLRGLREEAAVRQARPWIAGMSREAHRRLNEAVAASAEGTDEPEENAVLRRSPVRREAATAAGSAMHRVLEHFDLEAADPGRELERRREEALAWLAAAVPPGELAVARRRLQELVEAFRAGPLWERWLELRAHVIARELPVLLEPGEQPDGPVGALTGWVDLLYRDPRTGEPVVADHKTDDPGRIEERAEAYRGQVAAYAEALRRALGLAEPPRTELWFLAAGRVVRPDGG